MAAAAATAAGVVISSYLAKRGNDNSIKSQNRANDQAIEYEKGQQAKADAAEADQHRMYLAYLKDKNPAMYANYMASQQGQAGLPVDPAMFGGGGASTGHRRANPATFMPADFPGGTRGGIPAPVAGVAPEDGINTGTGRTLGEMMGGAPRAVRPDEDSFGAAPAPMPGAPTQGLGGLADYDWRRKITQPRATMGGR